MTDSADDFRDTFAHSCTLGGLWVESRHRPDYFPGHEQTAYEHQLATQAALEDGDGEVVVNTNPTGAGKTRSWVVPTLRAAEDGTAGDDDGAFVIAAYPTNALVEDQRQTLRNLIVGYFGADHEAVADTTVEERDGEPVVVTDDGSYPVSDLVRTVSGATTEGSTGAAITQAGEDAAEIVEAGLPVIVLTTPDTLTLAGLEQYSDRDVGMVPGLADRIVIDEFHLANPRGRRVLPFVVDLYRRLSGDDLSVVFLSATPDEAYVERLERAFDVTVVGRPVTTAEPPDDGSQILPSAELHVQSREMFSNGEWLAERADGLVDWHDGDGQLLVIVDAVREVEAVYEALVDRLDESRVGRIYGWKRRGRRSVIENSDVIVGNTAMEVGVDFDRVSRVVCTAYDAASAVQRIGRMRARSGLSGQEICLLTTPAVHGDIVRAGDRIERAELGEILGDHLDPVRATPYYELLVATLARYLWSDGELGDAIREDDMEIYKQIVTDHFGHALAALPTDTDATDPEAVWEEIGALLERYRTGEDSVPTFEEMSQFRGSSLTVTVLDVNDPAEPVKTAPLANVLRNRHGRVLPDRDALEREYEREFGEMAARDRRLVDTAASYSCGYFQSTGRREKSGDYRITSTGFEWEHQERRKNDGAFTPMPDLIASPHVEGPPGIGEVDEHLDLDDRVLAYRIETDPWSAREEYALGRYANLVSIEDRSGSASLALWQDAILTHARDVWRRLTDE